MTKLQLPREPSVMKQTTETSARTTRMTRTMAGRLQRILGSILAFPQEQIQKQEAADDADNHADRNFVRVADDAPQNVAGKHEPGPQNRDPWHGPAHVVADHQAHDVGHDQPEERDGADGDKADRRN